MAPFTDLKIVTYPHPALRRVARPVRQVDDDIRGICARMLELMYQAEGVGLAAPQVSLPLRIIVANPRREGEEPGREYVLINPKIVERKGVAEDREGCLSLPDLYAEVKRADRIKLTALDLDGQPLELELSGLPARVIQHEADHLQGILFIDKLSPLVKLRVAGQIREFERQYRQQQREGQIPPNLEIDQQLSQIEAAFR